MPELPEVETMRRGILGAVGGKITLVEKTRCLKKPISITPSITQIRRRIIGKRITNVDRIGKRVVVCVGGTAEKANDFLILEPRMTGLVLVANPPTDEHMRFRMEIAGSDVDEIGFWDRRGLGNVRLLNQTELNEQLGPSKIGPDAIKISAGEFFERFSASGREIKVALLDQKLIAGVGNLYASEMLHLAKIHPQRKCNEIKKPSYTKLHEKMLDILLDAIKHEGSTLSDGTYRNALNKDGSYQNMHQVYDRADEICFTCKKNKVIRIVQAQRATFFCRRCQR